MKKRYIAILILLMIVIGAISGGTFYIFFMSYNDLIIHCIGMGMFFGLVNSFLTMFFIKKFSVVKAKNEKLGSEIRVDELTQLYNRYAFENDDKSLSSDLVYSMIFLDIDNFRNFNNIYGHQAGDTVLKNCANIIKNCIRNSDLAYRYGGEELVVLLSGCAKKEAERIGQNIVESVRNYDNAPYSKMTISAGVASMPDDAQTFAQLVKASDSALLKAKEQGKDQLVAF
jgi:diguanylate cyclase